MADNSQVADALRTIAEAADDSTAAEDIETVAEAIEPDATSEAFYYAPNAGNYYHPTESSIYIRRGADDQLSRGIIVPAEDVDGEPDHWSWQHSEPDEDYNGKYTYERIAEAWEQAHE
jgi:hypothetical protein